jgi:hypothetical protein
MSIDFPRAWEISKATEIPDHDQDCSFRLTRGCVICDCYVVYSHPEYLDDILQTKGGEVIIKNNQA